MIVDASCCVFRTPIAPGKTSVAGEEPVEESVHAMTSGWCHASLTGIVVLSWIWVVYSVFQRDFIHAYRHRPYLHRVLLELNFAQSRMDFRCSSWQAGCKSLGTMVYEVGINICETDTRDHDLGIEHKNVERCDCPYMFPNQLV